MEHKSVLLQETIAGLDIQDNDIIVDMTLGGAGHAFAATQTGARNLTVIGIDADSDAGERAATKFAGSSAKFIFANVYFDKLKEVLANENIANVNKVIFDLGYSSFEIDNPERGFSFQHDGPLMMTYSKKPGAHELTAYDVVNNFEEENLADIIYGFGEETFSRRIAAAIVEAREKAPIKTSTELAQIIYESVPFFYRRGKTHPATKTFQAIRIAVNNELERLKTALHDSFETLMPQGRIAVITFHSLEDRIVKNYFRELAGNGQAKLVNKKPIAPTDEEIKANRRSRSAKLRVIEKI
jgi:16S rRNA (cytosine1402-N4)-methyltransferase